MGLGVGHSFLSILSITRKERDRGRRGPEEAREDQISLLRVRKEIGRKEKPRGGQRGPDLLITRKRGNREEGEAQRRPARTRYPYYA